MSTHSPDSRALHPPLTLSALCPFLLSYYAHAVLVILPHTFIYKLLLLPFILWQGWKCIVRYDYTFFLAHWFGHETSDKLGFLSFVFVCGMFTIALKAIEWTFTMKPLKRYHVPKHPQDKPSERRLSVLFVFLEAFELSCNLRGIGWSWSSMPCPRDSPPHPSIALLTAKAFLKLTVFDASQHLIQSLRPSTVSPKGGSIFDPNLSFVPRSALAAFCVVCGGVWGYALIDTVYHVSAIVGRTLFLQPASSWPRAFDRPWMSTSVQEFWNVRWHQFIRRQFILYGARPGGMLFGKPGAFMGGFTASAIFHHVGLWATGSDPEFAAAGGFFLLMGIGTIMELAFTRSTGLRIKGLIGWLWTMGWTTLCGTFLIEGWARHGMFATQPLPDGFRPGKVVVNIIIAMSRARGDAVSR